MDKEIVKKVIKNTNTEKISESELKKIAKEVSEEQDLILNRKCVDYLILQKSIVNL